ncbi:AAA family ATPase [Streptomyces aquilus]|uniref:AAA family ATPase n=1 Tax=Streptomyces aquilus TaxID=2548456 RepID=UPI0037D1BF02
MNPTDESRPLAQGERLPESSATNAHSQNTHPGTEITGSINSVGLFQRISPEHAARHFQAISPEVAKGCAQSDGEKIKFAYWHPDGTHHLVTRHPEGAEPRDEKGKPIRYQSEPDKRGLNVHPLVRELMATDAPIVVIEGTKQYLAGVTALRGRRLFSVGLNGIRGWQWKPGRALLGDKAVSTPLPDWGHIPLKGRKVYVVPDGDVVTNENVRAGAELLAGWLESQGAEVHRAAIPLLPEQPHTGLDDYLASLPTAKRQAAVLGLLEDAEDDSDDFFLSREELAKLPPVEPLMHGMLNKASVVWLSGKFGTYKTFLALAWSCCVATGNAWEGHRVERPGPVVYVAAEGHRGILGRTVAWEAGFNRARLTRNLIVTPKGLDPREPADMAKLTRQIKKTGAVMVVFDTLHRCAPGMDENSNKDAGEAFQALQRLKDETGVTVLVLHHTGHSGERARGASAMEDDADDAYVIKLAGDPEDRSPANTRVLIRRKSKEGEAGEEFRLKLVTVPGADPFDERAGASAYITLQDPAEVFASVRAKESNEERIIREMDEAGLPVGLSVAKSEAWLLGKGIQIRGRRADKVRAIGARKIRSQPSEEVPVPPVPA